MHSIACDTLFFDMRSYKIESYVPEETFLAGKDARFCRAAFEDCFAVDVHNHFDIIAACRNGNLIGKSLADAFSLSLSNVANLLHLFDGDSEFLALPCPNGTLLVYPAWPRIGIALAFLLKEDIKEVEKSYQNAKRYAFFKVFETDGNAEINQQLNLEAKICALEFYRNRLFGNKRETNAVAQILMIANLMGCRLHEMSVSRINATLDELETESLGAYLCCVFMTMRRYNGKISTSAEGEENTSILTHVPQEYGIRIQQTVRQRVTKQTAFDLPARSDIACFANHPAFADYKTEDGDNSFCVHLPIKQKMHLSAYAMVGREQEITLTLFLLS